VILAESGAEDELLDGLFTWASGGRPRLLSLRG
jgi:hypothetical protein